MKLTHKTVWTQAPCWTHHYLALLELYGFIVTFFLKIILASIQNSGFIMTLSQGQTSILFELLPLHCLVHTFPFLGFLLSLKYSSSALMSIYMIYLNIFLNLHIRKLKLHIWVKTCNIYIFSLLITPLFSLLNPLDSLLPWHHSFYILACVYTYTYTQSLFYCTWKNMCVLLNLAYLT